MTNGHFPGEADESRRRQGLLFLGAAVGCAGFAMALQMGLNSNYVADEIGVTGLQQGMLESIRESCGIIALGVLAVLAGFAEPLVGAAMLLLLAVGISAYTFAPTYGWVVVASVVWSQGLHVWMPLPNSMTLSLAEEGRAGFRLGQMRAAGSAGFGIGIVAAMGLVLAGVRIRPMFLVAGLAAVLGAAACLRIPRAIKTPGPRLVFRRRYGLYYALSFLEGWRKQIFVCFAGFHLVRNHHAGLDVILPLFGLVQLISYYASPRVGRLIDRVGERRVLVLYFSCLTVFFVGYALVADLYVLCVIFVVDNAFFVFATALTTFVNRIAPPREHTPTLSMGVAMNHVAAVAMPLAGGLLWQSLGYQWAFLVGAAAALGSVAVATRVPGRPAASAGPPSVLP
jgi:MFS family permease